jgi:hypothetical protein
LKKNTLQFKMLFALSPPADGPAQTDRCAGRGASGNMKICLNRVKGAQKPLEKRPVWPKLKSLVSSEKYRTGRIFGFEFFGLSLGANTKEIYRNFSEQALMMVETGKAKNP